MGATLVPEKILGELADLWVSLGKHGEGEEGAGVLRACSMTLVVVAEESEDTSELGEIVAALMPEHPARSILIRLHGTGERTLTERVYSQCWMPFGQRRQICCEQIEIVAPDESLSDLPSVLLPLLVADLPVILWCRSARLVAMPQFLQLARMANKVVLDSDSLADPKAALRRVAEAAKSGVLMGDLSWTRLTRWREMLSQIFENRTYLAQLPEVQMVTVGSSGNPPVSAWYLGAWVMRAMESAGVPVEFRMEHESDGAGEVLWVELKGPKFRLELSRWQDRMVTTVNGLAQCVHLPKPTPYLLMREELGIVRPDPVFERTLDAALQLAEGTAS
jgi:glucose-6-phosphate dehydrogenase assembly protein OpcA